RALSLGMSGSEDVEWRVGRQHERVRVDVALDVCVPEPDHDTSKFIEHGGFGDTVLDGKHLEDIVHSECGSDADARVVRHWGSPYSEGSHYRPRKSCDHSPFRRPSI